MGTKTGIEWTDATWNPLRGCSRVSEGCRNCYAETTAYRFSGAGQPYEGLAVLKNGHASWTGKVELVEKHLLDPLKWGAAQVDHRPDCAFRAWWVKGSRCGLCTCPARGKRIFVNSMSDVFHESGPDEWIDKIFAVMALCPQHTFQVLTKRPKRMLEYLTGEHRSLGGDMTSAKGECALAFGRPGRFFPTIKSLPLNNDARMPWPLPNVWLGVSVENQDTADERIPLLLKTPAAVRFISAEPLLEHLELCYVSRPPDDVDRSMPGFADVAQFYVDALFGCEGVVMNDCSGYDQERGSHPHLDWVICGGESGAGARPMHPVWARILRDQCKAAGVPFFFKQWGEWAPSPDERIEMGIETFLESPRHCFMAEDGQVVHSAAEMRQDVMDTWMERAGKHAAGALLDGVEHKEFPAAG